MSKAEINPDKMHVLVVDDEFLIRWSIAETLADAGYSIAQASNAAETLRALEDDTPDVVLLDHRLPESIDLGLLARIRQRLPHAAVILMTAFGSPDLIDGAMQ